MPKLIIENVLTQVVIDQDHLINLCIQKLSLSLLVTTLWTLWASTCGPLQTSEGILAQLMMTLYTYYKFASTQPPSDSLSPLSPYQPPRALIYIGDISHFLNIFNTLSQLVHHSCTTPPKQYCEVISINAYIPLLKRVYNYSSSPKCYCIDLTLIHAS